MSTDTQLELEVPAGPTPGPWNLGQPGGPAGPFWSLVNQHGEVVAMQITTGANARLIAAAPALYDACIHALRYVQARRLHQSSGIYQVLEDAIRQAEGSE